MRRLAVLAALAAVVLVSGCGPAGALEAPGPTSPSPTLPTSPSPSSTSTDAAPADTTPADTPPSDTPPAETDPADTEPATVAGPQSPPFTPNLPELALAPTLELEVLGAPLGSSGRSDLYVVCDPPLTVWSGAGRAPLGQPQPPRAYCGEFHGSLGVLVGLAADAARAHAVVEPDTTPPLVARTATGAPLDSTSRAALEARLGTVTRFDIYLECIEGDGSVAFGDVVLDCSGGNPTSIGVGAAGGAVPTVVADPSVTAILMLTPAR